MLQFKDCENFGEHKLVRKFIKGVFELRPALPRYSTTWDVDVVFEYLETLKPHDKLTLKEITLKLVMLLALLSGQRCQTITKLSLSAMKLQDTKCVFNIDFLIKQSRKGKHLAPIEFLAFPDNSSLCVLSVLREYLRRTVDIRGDTQILLISYQKPHKAVSTDTLARWLKEVLTRAGIDTLQFGAHSTRSASTSAAVVRGTPVDVVMKAAGWSAASTFTKFYRKPPSTNMGQALLDSFLRKQ